MPIVFDIAFSRRLNEGNILISIVAGLVFYGRHVDRILGFRESVLELYFNQGYLHKNRNQDDLFITDSFPYYISRKRICWWNWKRVFKACIKHIEIAWNRLSFWYLRSFWGIFGYNLCRYWYTPFISNLYKALPALSVLSIFEVVKVFFTVKDYWVRTVFACLFFELETRKTQHSHDRLDFHKNLQNSVFWDSLHDDRKKN